MLSITVDLDGASPPYEQLRNQFAGLIHAGVLAPGEKLPAIRAIASDLGIAPNTIARAYRELAANGLVVSRRRTGTVVQPRETRLSDEAAAHLTRFLEKARADGFTPSEIVDLVRGAMWTNGVP